MEKGSLPKKTFVLCFLIILFLLGFYLTRVIFSNWIGPSGPPSSLTNIDVKNVCSGIFDNSFVIFYISEEGGTFAQEYKLVTLGEDVEIPSLEVGVNHTLLGFSRLLGSGGSFNSSTGKVTGVSDNQLIRANLCSGYNGSCGVNDDCCDVNHVCKSWNVCQPLSGYDGTCYEDSDCSSSYACNTSGGTPGYCDIRPPGPVIPL